MLRSTRSSVLATAVALAALVSTPAAAAPIQRTRFELPTSNGHGALLVDLQARRATQLREHLFAVEEPALDAMGKEVWGGGDFEAIYTRDLLFDAYFGLRTPDEQRWLTAAPVDLDRSGYVGWKAGERGGTGIVAMVQTVGDLEATSYFFTPVGLPHAGFVILLKVRNTGAQALSGIDGFSIHNLHLGYGRAMSPWDVPKDIGENGETMVHEGDGDLVERGFAGTVVARPLGDVAHFGAAPWADVYGIVAGGAKVDLPDNQPPAAAVDGAVGAYQFTMGTLAPGAEAWAGVALVHYGDPQADKTAQGWLDAYVAGKGPKALLEAEIAGWAALQAEIKVPKGASPSDEALIRHSAAWLKMGQVQEDRSFLREWWTKDGEPRRTRFKGVDDQPVTLPAVVKHLGRGAVVASLPPGNWTYSWIRDGAYATVAMALLGMKEAARASLLFYLRAEAGRFKDWQELSGYGMPKYQITLVRYYGFGVEETDFNSYGPNLEFDGFGLFLWTLRAYERLTGDTSVADEHWPLIAGEVGDVLVALVDPMTGLIRRDSSIWETHWEGRERYFAYTSITAVRGLCDAAAIAERIGDTERATTYKTTALGLRAAIAERLTDADGALGATYEEIQAGTGYWDAAVIEAVSMGLFDPKGKIAAATMAGLDSHLQVAAGPGWSRNDDRYDHQGGEDLSPWGSDYDSAEWVITDLRGAIATRMLGAEGRSEALIEWVRDQALANYLMVAETFEENDGTYKFNTPMVGFGAGAFALALAHRSGEFGAEDPACGAYFLEEDEGETSTSGGETSGGESSGSSGGTSGDVGTSSEGSSTMNLTITDGVGDSSAGGASLTAGVTSGDGEDGGCACRSDGGSGFGALGALLGLIGWRRRQRPA
jgi:MYXO-CTERM domain-containing protein